METRTIEILEIYFFFLQKTVMETQLPRLILQRLMSFHERLHLGIRIEFPTSTTTYKPQNIPEFTGEELPIQNYTFRARPTEPTWQRSFIWFIRFSIRQRHHPLGKSTSFRLLWKGILSSCFQGKKLCGRAYKVKKKKKNPEPELFPESGGTMDPTHTHRQFWHCGW